MKSDRDFTTLHAPKSGPPKIGLSKPEKGDPTIYFQGKGRKGLQKKGKGVKTTEKAEEKAEMSGKMDKHCPTLR